jgi:hypothetical protein
MWDSIDNNTSILLFLRIDFSGKKLTDDLLRHCSEVITTWSSPFCWPPAVLGDRGESEAAPHSLWRDCDYSAFHSPSTTNKSCPVEEQPDQQY